MRNRGYFRLGKSSFWNRVRPTTLGCPRYQINPRFTAAAGCLVCVGIDWSGKGENRETKRIGTAERTPARLSSVARLVPRSMGQTGRNFRDGNRRRQRWSDSEGFLPRWSFYRGAFLGFSGLMMEFFSPARLKNRHCAEFNRNRSKATNPKPGNSRSRWEQLPAIKSPLFNWSCAFLDEFLESIREYTHTSAFDSFATSLWTYSFFILYK